MTSHLFTVEIMLEADTNGLALERLIHILNSNDITDYKVVKGIQLGKKVDVALKELKSQTEVKMPTIKDPGKKEESSLQASLQDFVTSGSLVRLKVIKGKGVRLSMPVRILNFNHDNEQITVYHVDEKRVYLLNLNEIEDFITY